MLILHLFQIKNILQIIMIHLELLVICNPIQQMHQIEMLMNKITHLKLQKLMNFKLKINQENHLII